MKYNKEGEEVYTSQETEDLTVKIDKLTAKDKYYFMVAAINESGQGDFTDKEYCQSNTDYVYVTNILMYI